MTGEELRERYFNAMRGADLDGVLALFADNAVAILPDGNVRNGKAALSEMFAGIFQNRPTPGPGPITGTGDYWAIEVETKLPDGNVRNTANFFRLNADGLISHMRSYRCG
jgi:hypothetical protein